MSQQHPPPAYDLQRSEGNVGGEGHIHPSQSVDYSEATETTATGAGASYRTPHRHGNGPSSASVSSPATPTLTQEARAAHRDSTETVREMHLALLHLLTNPDEFQRAASYRGRIPDLSSVVGSGIDRSTLASWNASYDEGATDVGTEPGGGDDAHPPLPYLVFAEDAEVVLPQAHTASQLFGLERSAGIELEAAAGVPALSQLFLRWLALMPGGDHCSVIEPPGLTVMRIAGGRYRCTAAHRAVWTWSTEFLPEVFSSPDEGSGDEGGKEGGSGGGSGKKRERRKSGRTATSPAAAAAAVAAGSVGPISPPRSPRSDETLHMGDLVSMTVVDVFETDTDGRLLSYCPTFDNRDIRKTTAAAERLRKGGESVRRGLNVAARSTAAAKMTQAAGLIGRMGLHAAASVKEKISEEIKKKDTGGGGDLDKSSPGTKPGTPPKAGDAAREAKANGSEVSGNVSMDDEAGAGGDGAAIQRTPGVAVDATGGVRGGGGREEHYTSDHNDDDDPAR